MTNRGKSLGRGGHVSAQMIDGLLSLPKAPHAQASALREKGGKLKPGLISAFHRMVHFYCPVNTLPLCTHCIQGECCGNTL